MTERHIKPGHTHAAQALAPLCREMEQALSANLIPAPDPCLSPAEWDPSWLQRITKAATRIADGINYSAAPHRICRQPTEACGYVTSDIRSLYD